MADSKEKSILKRLREETVNEIVLSVDLMALLSVDITNHEQDITKLVLFTAKFLQAVKDVVFSGQCSTDMINSTLLCSKFYRDHVDESKLAVKELTMQLLFYHIMAKIPWQSYVDELLKVGEEMYNLLNIVKHQINGITPIIHNLYGLLWKMAGDLEKKTMFSDFAFSLRLRMLALKIQVFKPDTEKDLIDKLSMSVERYAFFLKNKQMCVLKKSEEIKSMYHLALEFSKMLIKRIHESDEANASVLKLLGQLLKLLLKFNLFEESFTFLEQLKSELKCFVSNLVSTVLTTANFLCIPLHVKIFEEIDLQVVLLTFNKMKLSNNNILLDSIADLFTFCQIQMKTTKLLESVETTTVMDSLLMFFEKQQDILTSQIKYLKNKSDSATLQKVLQCEKVLVEIFKSKILAQHKLLLTSHDDERRKLVENIKIMCLQDLTSADSLLSDKTRPLFQKSLGNMMEKLGLCCYNLDIVGSDIYFGELSCQLLTDYCTVSDGTKQAKINETHIWQAYENLAEYYKKSKEWRCGLEIIVKGLLVDPKQLPSFVKRWVQIKLCAIDEGLEEFYQQNVKSVCKESDLISDELFISFLKNEHQLLQKKKCIIGVYYVLKQLECVLNDGADKASYLIQLASSTWPSPIEDERTSEDYLNSALSLFPEEGDSSEMEKILIGQIYLWKYVVQHENACKKLVVDENDDDIKDEEWDHNKDRILTLSEEEEMISILDVALHLWSDSYNTNFDDVAKKQNFIDSLKLTSSIYFALKKPLQECKVLVMLRCVCEDSGLYRVDMDIVRLLISLGLYDTALHILSTVDHQTDLNSNDKLLYQIRKIEASLSQVIEQQSENILLELDSNLSKHQNKDTTACLIRGTTNRLLSTVSALQTGDNSTGLHYALDHGHDAVRLHTGVTHFFLNKKCKGGNYQQKWFVISELLESLLNLVQLYRFIGDDSMARCYAREGLKTSQGLLLPRWYLLFKFELCRIHSITCCIKESQDVIQDISSILYPSETLPFTKLTHNDKIIKLSNNQHSENNFYRKKSLVDDCFGFESIRDAGVIKFPESEIDKETPEIIFEHKLPQICVPDHNFNCKCSACNDDSLLDLTCKYWFVLAEACYYNKYYAQAGKLLDRVLERYKEIRPRVSQNFTQIQQILSVSKETEDVMPSCYDRNLYESYCLLAECSLHTSSSDHSLTVCNKALHLLDLDTKNNVEKNLLRARVNMCLVQLELNVKSFISSDINDDFKNMFITEKTCDVVQDLSMQLNMCHIENTATHNNIHHTKFDFEEDSNTPKDTTKYSQKIQFDSPIQETHPSNSHNLIPMEESSTEDIHSDVIPGSPENICKTLFMKTPLQSSRKMRSRKTIISDVTTPSDNVFITDDELAEIFDDSQKKDIKLNLLKKATRNAACRNRNNVNTPSDVKLVKHMNRRQKSGSCSVKLDETNNKPRRRIRTTKTPLKIVSSSDDDKDATQKESKNSSHIPRLKLKNSETAYSSKSKTNKKKIDTDENITNQNTKNPRPKRSIKKSTLDIDSEDDQEPETIEHTKPSRSRRKPKIETPLNSSEPRICRGRSAKSFKKEEDCSTKDIYSFDEYGSPLKSKRITRKKSRKPTKKSLDSDELEIPLCPEKTPERIFHTDFETLHEISPKMNSPSNSILNSFQTVKSNYFLCEDDIEILRGKNSTCGRSNKNKSKPEKEHTPAEFLKSETSDEVIIEKPSLCSKGTAEKTSDDQTHIISTLEKAYQQVRHFPASPSYQVICKLLALQYLKISPDKTAFYLTESAAVTFRHQTLVDIGKKIRKLKKEKNDISDVDKELSLYDDVRQSLIFNKEENNFTSMLNNLPEEWTVCQVSIVENAGKTSQMLLTRLTRHMKPITVPLPGFNSLQGATLLQQFTSIIEASGETVKTENKYEFWKNRKIIDDRMRAFQDDMQHVWLGVWKNLLLGQLEDNVEFKKLESMALEDMKKYQLSEKDNQLVKVLISVSHGLSCVELAEIMSILMEVNDKSKFKSLVTNIKFISNKVSSLSLKRHPVILILDKTIQHLPWESIGVLREHGVTRVPSLYSLTTQLTYLRTNQDNVFNRGIDINNTYYVVNPDDNLPSTQQFFETSYLGKSGWRGVIGERPSTVQYTEALTQSDLFIYCGHGDGVKYFQGDEIQKLHCRAAVLLMGCSSGLLKSKGPLDAFGTILNYFLAGCPCVVGNLWNVTDREIDRFCKCLLDTWLESESGTSILEIMPKAREACRLLYLTGSAPIVYGLPVFKTK